MLINVGKCSVHFSLQRLIVTAAIASVMTTIFIYVVLINDPPKPDAEITHINMDVKYFITEINIINDTDSMDGKYIDTLSPIEVLLLEERMAERRENLEDACEAFNVNATGKVNTHEFLINDKYNLVWCNVFKAASTSWLYNFNVMAGYTEEEAQQFENPQEKAREKYPTPTEELLSDSKSRSTSMIIVRHPFERLASVYADKILNAGLFGPYADLADAIVKKYRETDSDDVASLWPTFEEFVMYILDEADDGNALDGHWAPYTSVCTPCHYNFNVIVKFETLEDDQRYVIHKAGLQDVVKPQWINPGFISMIDKEMLPPQLIKSFYSQLSEDQISDLYQIYRYDFMMFDYGLDEYYNMSKDNKIITASKAFAGLFLDFEDME